MDDSRIPKQLLFGELSQGTIARGRPKKRYKDCAKEDLKICDFGEQWYEETADRSTWRGRLRHGKELSETKLAQRREVRQLRRHIRASNHQ